MQHQVRIDLESGSSLLVLFSGFCCEGLWNDLRELPEQVPLLIRNNRRRTQRKRELSKGITLIQCLNLCDFSEQVGCDQDEDQQTRDVRRIWTHMMWNVMKHRILVSLLVLVVLFWMLCYDVENKRAKMSLWRRKGGPCLSP